MIQEADSHEPGGKVASTWRNSHDPEAHQTAVVLAFDPLDPGKVTSAGHSDTPRQPRAPSARRASGKDQGDSRRRGIRRRCRAVRRARTDPGGRARAGGGDKAALRRLASLPALAKSRGRGDAVFAAHEADRAGIQPSRSGTTGMGGRLERLTKGGTGQAGSDPPSPYRGKTTARKDETAVSGQISGYETATTA
jgi:hypothetical protein